jgi:hypothetical protein
MLVFLGVGLSLNNTRAVGEALLGKQSSFLRTPKFNLRGRKQEQQKNSSYLLPRDANVWIESLLTLYAAFLLIYALSAGLWSIVPWLFMYICGFSYVVGLNFMQSRQRAPQKGFPNTKKTFLRSSYQTSKTIQPNPESITLDEIA